MNNPCEHCNIADDRPDYFKCDKPCSTAKQCYKNSMEMIDVLRGFMPKLNGLSGKGE